MNSQGFIARFAELTGGQPTGFRSIAMYYFAIAIIPVAVLIVLAFSIAHFSGRYLGASLIDLGLLGYAAWYFLRRSRNLEAQFFTSRVGPGEEEDVKLLMDALLFSGTIFFLALLVYFPVSGKF